MMQTFSYDDGTVATIVELADGIAVNVQHAAGDYMVVGFPTVPDAYNFLCWGDLEGADDIPPAQAFRDNLRWVPQTPPRTAF